MCNMFRTLKADEIECRIAQISSSGLTLLLYKDARCDMNILDETVGPFNWQRTHSRDNANCTVGIWVKELNQWVWKEDTGAESFTEKEKGLASDSFKRACFNWGIGRELYTAPRIWIPARNCNIKPDKNGKQRCYDNFSVTEIKYDESRRISYLEIYNHETDCVVFRFGKDSDSKPAAKKKTTKKTTRKTTKKEQKKEHSAYATEEQYQIVDKGRKAGLIKTSEIKAIVEAYGKSEFMELSYDQAQLIVKQVNMRMEKRNNE